ncbi:MAG: c-type cytochrome [Gemmatimonadales bacterium]
MKIVKILGVVLAVLLLAGFGFYGWAASAASRKLSRTLATHSVDFPIPFPLSAAELQRDRLAPEAAAQLAQRRALERGRHLVESRYACTACHGSNFGGGVMVDDPAIGHLLAPNITSGRGSRTSSYRAADWDHIVRHGVKPDGSPALMPSQDFREMSDQELSDIIVFVRSQPPVVHRVPASALGPLGKVLVATGKLVLSADVIGSRGTPHPVAPPATAPTADFGVHLAATCKGCHGADLAGGPIVGGAPAWPPAANLTPRPGGIGGWTLAQFAATLRTGTRPDRTRLRVPMSEVVSSTRNMTDVEMEALWHYLQSLPVVDRPS